MINEKELIEKARAAKVEREKEEAEQRALVAKKAQEKALLNERREITLAYMRECAKRFPVLAKKIGLYSSLWSLTTGAGGAFNVKKNGSLYRKDGTKVKKYSDCIFPGNQKIDNLVGDPALFTEAEMRQRVDKLFEDALMGNPQSSL